LVFFFQAEDGIRDFHVTGVQTCALPILKMLVACRKPCRLAMYSLLQYKFRLEKCEIKRVRDQFRESGFCFYWYKILKPPLCQKRSEERCVGKECRYR